MPRCVLLRHGESQWNLEDRFTGWTDVDLSETGMDQAARAGRLLHGNGYTFDIAYTSYLKRAIRTLWVALDRMDRMWLPVARDWRLNERHYGALQGENKRKFEELYGKEQVYAWRRSFDVRPPRLEMDDPRHPRFDVRYAKLDPQELPSTESLADTVNRVMPFWREVVWPRLREGEDVLIAAHGNSLRALVKHLDDLGGEGITQLNIPLAIPRVYEFDDHLAIRRRFYLRETGEEALD